MWLFAKIRHWFSLEGKVSRKEYVLTGVGLMLFKYAVEAGVIGYTTGKFYSPLDFINPLLSARSQFTVGAPEWLGFAWVMWTVLFVWIALTMSMRRSLDAGATPWAGFFVLIPIFNFLVMLYLASIPKNYAERSRETLNPSDNKSLTSEVSATQSALFGIAVGFAYSLASVVLCIYFFKSYGAALFFGTPLITGAVTGYSYNRWYVQSTRATLGLASIAALSFAAGLLLLGLEGVVCLVMATPIMLPLGILGALVGRAIAIDQHTISKKKDQGLLGCLLVLPFIAGLEPHVTLLPEYEVLTSIDIAAPPAEVWDLVVDFPPITSPDPWYFRWGIASPREATIDGQGVGAIRYCKFTTGEFVEPITVWDEPHRLAFDVTDQPEPMTELSPYRHVHPPHLDGSFRSTHGEFRLIELPDGHTRLEGRTWYQIDMGPTAYWTIWTDALIHRIHLRVLEHIKQRAEAPHTL